MADHCGFMIVRQGKKMDHIVLTGANQLRFPSLGAKASAIGLSRLWMKLAGLRAILSLPAENIAIGRGRIKTLPQCES